MYKALLSLFTACLLLTPLTASSLDATFDTTEQQEGTVAKLCVQLNDTYDETQLLPASPRTGAIHPDRASSELMQLWERDSAPREITATPHPISELVHPIATKEFILTPDAHPS